LLEILRDELNVRAVHFIEGAEELVTFSARPNFRALGARHGKRTPKVADAVRQITSASLAAFRNGQPLEVEVDGERIEILESELEIVQTATGDYVVEAQGGYTVALDPAVTPELRAEGLARELVSRIQRLRKESGFDVSDRIRLGVGAPGPQREAFEGHRDFIMGETLALEMEVTEVLNGGWSTTKTVDLEDGEVVIGVSPIERAGVA
jgi:isoleucyl-tRNA synthetase